MTHAVSKLGMSQPAVSNALSRLRQHLGNSLPPLGTNDPTDVLLNRRADIVFSVDPIRHEQLRSTLLISELCRLVARKDHPLLSARDALSADDFFAAEFVVLTPSLRRLGNISREIDAQTRQRHIVESPKACGLF